MNHKDFTDTIEHLLNEIRDTKSNTADATKNYAESISFIVAAYSNVNRYDILTDNKPKTKTLKSE